MATFAGWLLAAGVFWAVLIGAAALVEAATRGRVPLTRWVGCPPRVRRALLAGLGLALVAGPGQAAEAGSSPPVDGSRHDTAAPRHTLPVPARPLGTAAPAARPMVVRSGDTLWALARSRLPDTATPAEVLDLVRGLHHRNEAVIGPDPDLIRPGQRLTLPPQIRASHSHALQSHLEEKNR